MTSLGTRAAVLLLVSVVPFAVPAATADDRVGREITGEVQLSPAIARRVQSGGTLFVYVRAVGQDSGPPVAVVAIKQPSYPQRFALRPSDQMVANAPPQTLNGRYRLYARHSDSGQPMAQEGFLGTTLGSDGKGVRAGAGVKVVIDKPLQ